MENIDKGLTVPKWVLMNRPKIPQIPKKLSAQFICPSPKVWGFDEKMLHWASVVREPYSISEPYRETRSCWHHVDFSNNKS